MKSKKILLSFFIFVACLWGAYFIINNQFSSYKGTYVFISTTPVSTYCTKSEEVNNVYVVEAHNCVFPSESVEEFNFVLPVFQMESGDVYFPNGQYKYLASDNKINTEMVSMRKFNGDIYIYQGKDYAYLTDGYNLWVFEYSASQYYSYTLIDNTFFEQNNAKVDKYIFDNYGVTTEITTTVINDNTTVSPNGTTNPQTSGDDENEYEDEDEYEDENEPEERDDEVDENEIEEHEIEED